jgi:hypothetical protein
MVETGTGVPRNAGDDILEQGCRRVVMMCCRSWKMSQDDSRRKSELKVAPKMRCR